MLCILIRIAYFCYTQWPIGPCYLRGETLLLSLANKGATMARTWGCCGLAVRGRLWKRIANTKESLA